MKRNPKLNGNENGCKEADVNKYVLDWGQQKEAGSSENKVNSLFPESSRNKMNSDQTLV